MHLILIRPKRDNYLRKYYERAFTRSVELAIVNAYLTEWKACKLSAQCRRLRVIIGTDFGITRRKACYDLLNWLPANFTSSAFMADGISGFHPKAVFWKEKGGKTFAIVGSSNLTHAAFNNNFEANAFESIDASQYMAALEWLNLIEKKSSLMNVDVVKNYQERELKPGKKASAQAFPKLLEMDHLAIRGSSSLLSERRRIMKSYNKIKGKLDRLFRNCANGVLTNSAFYERLNQYWSADAHTRIQGFGWEIKGKHSDFKALAKSFVKIINASKLNRDDVVIEELDRLSVIDHPARKAFFSEMLCLRFPEDYPVLNAPVWAYLKDIKFRMAKGSTEGAKYLELARTLRYGLDQNPRLGARNLAELDCMIWFKYHKKVQTP